MWGRVERCSEEVLSREALSPFLQEASSSSLEGSQVFDVDKAPPDLEGTLVLQASECSGHSLPVRPDHGAKVLMSVACGYANLPGSLHPFALDEEEDQASEPCWHLFQSHVLHARLVVVEALREEAYYPDAYLRLLKDQAFHLGTLHSEHDGGLHGLGVGLPEGVRGEGHLTEDRPRIHHFEGELS